MMKTNSWLALVLITALCALSCARHECPVPEQRVFVLKGDPYIKDANISSYVPTAKRGKDERIMLGAWTFNGDPHPIRTLIGFNLSAIPRGAEIEKAELVLYADTTIGIGTGVFGHSQLTQSNKWHIKPITSAWEEDSVSWNNRPSFDDAERVNMSASISNDETYIADITNLIKNQIANPGLYFGVQLQVDTEVHYNILDFCSKEHRYAAELGPQLRITYKR